MEESEIGVAHVVECYLGVDPSEVLLKTFSLVLHNTHVKFNVVIVQTFVELSSEYLDPHDGEHQPEHQADQQDVEYGGDGQHQSVHYDLVGFGLS